MARWVKRQREGNTFLISFLSPTFKFHNTLSFKNLDETFVFITRICQGLSPRNVIKLSVVQLLNGPKTYTV